MNIVKSTQFWLWLVPFLIWMFFFRFFLSGQTDFISDAVSYYEHIGIFTDQLAKGHYQLWDPFWYDGAPYHFFLRRIGEFNPFYLIIVALKVLGMGHPTAYIIFQVFYYALGMIGFYLLLRHVLHNNLVAYMGYLLLLFSSWGTQLFYNYIILLFVPLVWFFYFLLKFFREYRCYQWVGLCFCLGMIITTYIPFYFLTIFSLFILLMLVFYPKECWHVVIHSMEFVKKQRLLVALTSVFLAVSVLPGYVLYQESKAGDFVMPLRGEGADVSSAVAVGIKKAASGDFVNNTSFDKYFGHLDGILLGDFFIPYIFLVFLGIAAFAKINRLILSMFVMMSVLMLITITQSSFLHEWLFKHIFFFKFIRNIYYFFWLAILPLSVGWVCACLVSLVQERHPLMQHILSHYPAKRIIVAVTVSLIIGQSYVVYRDLTDNMKINARPITYLKADYEGGKFKNNSVPVNPDSALEGGLKNVQLSLYYASRWYADVYQRISTPILDKFSSSPIRLYDNTQLVEQVDARFWKTLERSMLNDANMAYIFDASPADERHLDEQALQCDVLTKEDPRIVMKEFGPNSIVLHANLSKPQFLVLTNNYHKLWHVTINHKPIKLIRANYTYQGVWLDAGKSEIHFQFDQPMTYAWHWALLGIFTSVLGVLIFLWIRRR